VDKVKQLDAYVAGFCLKNVGLLAGAFKAMVKESTNRNFVLDI